MRTCAAAALLLGLAAPAAAQNQQYINAVRVQLERAGAHVRQRGFTPLAGLSYGTLNAGARDTRPLELTAGVRYVVIGMCDQDCSDLDLRLYGSPPDTAQIAQDVQTDDRPLLELTAPRTGTYRLMVMMASCRQSPCYWGVQVFQKQ
jgi:hypothetical protein